jgi:hypothetical protein
MYNSPRAIELTEDWIHRKLPADHFALLRHLTVRLHAPAMGTGKASNAFTGTGVIVRLDGDRTYVVTAKHNLHVAGRGALVPIERYRETFVEKVRVEFTPPAGDAVWGRIDQVDLADDDIANQGYDVAVARVGDPAFARAVRVFADPATGPGAFTSDEWKAGGRSILQLQDARTARSVLLDGKAFAGPRIDVEGDHRILQFGHGRAAPGETPFAFAYRAFPVAGLKNPRYIDQTRDHYQAVFVFDTTSQISTTYEGDSGGPTFAIDKDGASSFLVGATLGANYYADRIDDDPASPIANNASTVLTSEWVNRFD